MSYKKHTYIETSIFGIEVKLKVLFFFIRHIKTCLETCRKLPVAYFSLGAV